MKSAHALGVVLMSTSVCPCAGIDNESRSHVSIVKEANGCDLEEEWVVERQIPLRLIWTFAMIVMPSDGELEPRGFRKDH